MATRYTVSRDIDAPIADTWALLTNDRWAEWNPTIVSFIGPIEVGRKVELVSTLDPKRTFKLRVDAMDAPHKMVWSDGMPLGLFRGTRTYTLTETGPSTCRFDMTEEYTGLLKRLITKAIPDMSQSFADFADGLKAAAEE